MSLELKFGAATFLVVSALSTTAFACIWDSDTMRDELQIRGTEDFDLISGQFAHHGEGYYLYRIRHTRELLKEKPADADLRNDLAIAQLKLGRYEEARRGLEALLAENPTRYRTLSNLGVLHKKMGNFSEAAQYTARALAMKPAGHLGLGDYYEKMLTFRAREGVPSESFLGVAYAGWSPHRDNEADKDRIRSMVRADQHFADGVLVLGDQLASEGELNHALWAFVRARKLGHPNPAAIQRRIDWIFEHWRESIQHSEELASSPKKNRVRRGDVERVTQQTEAIAQIERDLDAAAKWLEAFQRVEGELIKKVGDAGAAKVDFAAVEAELERQGIKRFRPGNRGMTGTS